MSKFEDRLWAELVLDHGPQLAARTRVEVAHRSRRGPLAAGAVAVAGALAVVALAATTGTSPSAAYSVSEGSDGSVTISIREFSGVDGANAQLSRLHVRVRVARVEAGCSTTGEVVPVPRIVSDLVRPEGEAVTVRPELIPQGETLVISARPLGEAIALNGALYRGPAPSCVGPGDGNVG